MLIVNIIFILALLGFIGAGTKDGLVHTVGRLVGAIIGFVAARAWSINVAGFLALFMPAGIARLIAFIVIFIVISRLVGFLFKLVDGIFKILTIIPFLKSIDNLLGAIGGLAEGIIIIGGITFLIHTYALEPHLLSWVSSSVVAQWIEQTFRVLLGVLL